MRAGGLVLAGGRSRRMGTAKAALDWHGTPLVRHVTDRLAGALGGGPVLVVCAPGQLLPPLAADVGVVEDPEPGRGPLQGLAAGLAALEADVAVAVATDQPFIGPALVDRLLTALRAGDDAVAIRIGERLQPLGAAYRSGLHRTARQRLDAGDASLRGLLGAVGTRVLDGTAADAAALRSLDTPGDYAAALREAPPRA